MDTTNKRVHEHKLNLTPKLAKQKRSILWNIFQTIGGTDQLGYKRCFTADEKSLFYRARSGYGSVIRREIELLTLLKLMIWNRKKWYVYWSTIYQIFDEKIFSEWCHRSFGHSWISSWLSKQKRHVYPPPCSYSDSIAQTRQIVLGYLPNGVSFFFLFLSCFGGVVHECYLYHINQWWRWLSVCACLL